MSPALMSAVRLPIPFLAGPIGPLRDPLPTVPRPDVGHRTTGPLNAAVVRFRIRPVSRLHKWTTAAFMASVVRCPASLRPEAGTARERGSRRLPPC